jgi:hypothetical protein
MRKLILLGIALLAIVTSTQSASAMYGSFGSTYGGVGYLNNLNDVYSNGLNPSISGPGYNNYGMNNSLKHWLQRFGYNPGMYNYNGYFTDGYNLGISGPGYNSYGMNNSLRHLLYGNSSYLGDLNGYFSNDFYPNGYYPNNLNFLNRYYPNGYHNYYDTDCGCD